MGLESIASRLTPLAFTLLRIISGSMFALHGVQKILHWPGGGGAGPTLGSQMWFGGLIELLTGTLIAIGLFTRPAAFLASGTMAVAYTQFHWRFAFDEWNWLPLVNKGELAALYCFVFLFIFAHGAGPVAVDRRG